MPEKNPKVDKKSLEYVCYTTSDFEAQKKYEHQANERL